MTGCGLYRGKTPATLAGNVTVEAAIKRIVGSFNRGDIAAAKAAHVAAPIIFDNVPPFI